MTLTFGTAPATTGPGMRVFVHIPAGPIPNDDFVQVSLNRASDGSGYTYGTKITNGSLLVLVTFGWDERLNIIAGGTTEGMAQGTAMQIVAQQYHANFTLVDSSVPTAWGTLDLLSYPWSLLAHVQAGLAPDIAAIKAAVMRQFPPSA